MQELSADQINLLRQNARSVVRELGLLNDAYFDIGVTLAERHLLIELNTSISPTVGDIAERLLLDKSTASRLIAKAVNKGYVKYSEDAQDKRRRHLQMTEKGRKVLNTFEPIAFDQTKQALETLSNNEVETIFKGIALYAQGLKNARMKGKNPADTAKQHPHPGLLKIYGELKDLGYRLEPFKTSDEKALYAIFREVVDSGSQFPYESNTLEEFHRQFFGPHSQVYVCRSHEGEIVGGFYLKQNYSGRSGHIANAAYMISSSRRGQGIGTLLINASLYLALERGFNGMQFNMVLSQNKKAIKLYQRLGFEIVGTIPKAVRNPDGSFQDGHVMYRDLIDLVQK